MSAGAVLVVATGAVPSRSSLTVGDRLRFADVDDAGALAAAAVRWLVTTPAVQLAAVGVLLVVVGAGWWDRQQRRSEQAAQSAYGTGWFWDDLGTPLEPIVAEDAADVPARPGAEPWAARLRAVTRPQSRRHRPA